MKEAFIAGDSTYGVFQQWHYNDPTLEPLGAMTIAPTGGNPGAWFRQQKWSDIKTIVGLQAPATDSVWTISFDWIRQTDNLYQNEFVMYGLMNGQVTSVRAGTQFPMDGVLLVNTGDLGHADTWTRKSFDVNVPAGFDAISLVWRIGSDASSSLLRGFDNVLVVDNTQPAPHPGDANLDGKVSVGDLGILAANYGATGLDLATSWGKGDFNGDGNVSVGDLGILAANYGFGTIPEPASLSLLGLGVLALRRRR